MTSPNASKSQMHRGIDAARRAFDESDWSTNRALRKRCLEQLQDAIEAEREELREELILEVGCPRMVTLGPQLDAPLADALRYPAKLIEEYPWEEDLGDAMVDRHRPDDPARDLARGRRCGGCDRAVELPVRGFDQQAGPGAGHRQHRRAQVCTGYALQRTCASAGSSPSTPTSPPVW